MLQSTLEENAKSYGYKSANLMILKAIAQKANEVGLKSSIPAIEPLSHELVEVHLNRYCPEMNALWLQFVEAQAGEDKGLANEAKPILAKIRELVIQTFTEHPLPEGELSDFLGALEHDDLLMVRSTGMEDSADLANPGGNESIAAVKPTQKDISIAIGEVVASYFSEKSLEQRIKGHDDISGPPFMPVLLQKMIGEPLVEDMDELVVSGVMYTGERGTTINMAPGHGELIVNSKAPFDTVYVTSEGVVNPQVSIKPYRLVPTEIMTEKGPKRTLELVENKNKEMKNSPSVPLAVAKRISDIGDIIEKEYGMPMDVEFVYKPKTDTIYIVQARPIPKGDLRNVIPSSIRPEQIKQAKKACDYQRGQVISSAGEATQVITSPDEIMICNDVGIALDEYLKHKDSKIKAVVVRRPAPATSHEAAEFNSKAIPVIQIDNLSKVEAMLNNPNACVIVDPQRKMVLDWSSQLEEPLESKAQLFEGSSPLLANGLFKSPMTLVQTIIPPPFEGKGIEAEQLIEVDKTQKIGDLFKAMAEGNPLETKKAFSQITTEYYNITQLPEHTKGIGSLEEMMDALETIEASNPNNIEDSKLALRKYLNLLMQLSRSDAFSEETHQELLGIYKNALATGLEIERLLDHIENLPKDMLAKDYQPVQREMLNLVNRLEAITTFEGSKDVFSNSVIQSLTEESFKQRVALQVEHMDLSKNEFLFLVQFLKMGELANNSELKGKWQDFCMDAIKDPMCLDALARMQAYFVKNDLGSFYINTFFKRTLSDRADESAKMITAKMLTDTAKVMKNLDAMDFKQINQKIDSWERNIGSWSEPGKFEELYRDFTADFDFILAKLDKVELDKMGVTEKALVFGEINRLTETLDKSLKTLKGSLDYEDKKLQADRFAQLLDPYFNLMMRQVGQVSAEKIRELKEKIGASEKYATKESILQVIDEVFKEKCVDPGPEQLSASRKFGVSSAVITSPASFERQFVYKRDDLTLEDMFTLFHQNIIAANTILTEDLNLKPDEMPGILQDLIESVDEYKLEYMNEEFPAHLISSRYEHPEFCLHYNIPLASHAASFDVKYDVVENKMKFNIEIFGEARDRFPKIENFAKNYLNILGANVIKAPNFSEGKSMLSCEFEITPSSPELIYDSAKLAKMMSRISFHDNKFSIEEVVNMANHHLDRKEAIEESIPQMIKSLLFKRGSRLYPQDTHALIKLCEKVDFSEMVMSRLFRTIKENTSNTYWTQEEGISDLIRLNKIMYPDTYMDKLAVETLGRSTFFENVLKQRDYDLADKLMDNENFDPKNHRKAVEIVAQNKDYEMLEKLIDKKCYSSLNPATDKQLRTEKPDLHSALEANKPDEQEQPSNRRNRRPPGGFRRKNFR